MAAVRPPILYVSPCVPLEHGIGSERRAFQHLRALLREHDVHLLITGRPKPRAGNERIWRERPASVTVLGRPEAPEPQGRWPGSHLLWEIGHPPIPRRVPLDDLPDAWPARFAATLVFRLKNMPFRHAVERAGVEPGRTVLDLDDLEALALRRRIAAERDVLGREKSLALTLRAARLARFERASVARADAVLVCSSADRERLIARGVAPPRVHVVPNAPPEVAPLAPRRRTSGEPWRLLFIGSLGYSPNIDAMFWFVHEILPRIRAMAGAGVVLEIAGYGAVPQIRALDRVAGVRVIGEVPSVEPCYARADLLIAPIRSGGGTRIKILEAFAIGRPVVATGLAAEGLPVAHERELLLADRPTDFAAAVVRLFEDEDLRTRLVAHGRALVERMRGLPERRLLAAVTGAAASPSAGAAADDRPAGDASG